MRAVLVLLAACSGATPEPAPTVKPRDATAQETPPPSSSGPPVPTPCGAPGSTTPPAAVASIVAGSGTTCARLVDGTVWCWGERGQTLIRSDATAAMACPVATRVEPFGIVDDLWSSSYRSTCVAAKGSVRCGVIADWGFHPTPTPLDARVGFEWRAPCAITNDRTIRCYLDHETKEAAALGPVDAIAIENGTLCALSQTAVSCLRGGNAEVLASNVAQIAAGEKLWALRNDGTVHRLDECGDGPMWRPCAVPLVGVSDAVSIASAGTTVCAVLRGGGVACAECVAKSGCKAAAKDVDGVTDATQIAVGAGHACALRKTGEVVCWGNSTCGQAGGSAEPGKACEKPVVVSPTTIVWAK